MAVWGRASHLGGGPALALRLNWIRRGGNWTLDALAGLIEAGRDDRGVRGVITYNYDNRVELVLDDVRHQSIHQVGDLTDDVLPIAHVHCLVPLIGEGSRPDDIVFTEDQYHMAARDTGIKSDEERIENAVTQAGVKSAHPAPMSSSGVKGPMYAMQIAGILEEVRKVDEAQQTEVLKQLRVYPIWYDSHDEIPEILGRISGGS